MRTRRLLLPVLALTLALAGCSGSDPEPEQTATEQAEDSGKDPAKDPSKQPADEPTQEETTEPADDEPAGDTTAALDAYVDAERATIPQIMETMGELYTSVEINPVYPDGVEYVYVYAEPLDPTAAGAYFEEMVDSLQTMCETAVFPAMERAGVVGSQQVTYTYLNPDGSEVWSHVFSS